MLEVWRNIYKEVSFNQRFEGSIGVGQAKNEQFINDWKPLCRGHFSILRLEIMDRNDLCGKMIFA